MSRPLLFLLPLAFVPAAWAEAPVPVKPELLDQVVEWRRDLHAHPELGNHETRTAQVIAAHLRRLGLTPKTGIAHTGVTARLKGGKPGPRVALRADMDALPVVEQTGLPFASTVRSEYRGQPVGVMHACGHDMHVSILMGVADALVARRDELPGEVLFVFQPAEEGPPVAGEAAGAELMLEQGIFADFKPDAVLGLHVWAGLHVGQIGVRSGGMMASADEWTLTVKGKQTHGSQPWAGVDPITVGAQILLGAQSIIARQVDITRSPVVLTAGQFQAGVRFNIIPDEAILVGTLRTFDPALREDVIARFRGTAEHFAGASGASASLEVVNNAPALINDAALYRQLLPSLERAVGTGSVVEVPPVTAAEDFSRFADASRGLFFFVGSTAADKDPATMPMNHSPFYAPDEGALEVGLRAMLQATLDFLGAS